MAKRGTYISGFILGLDLLRSPTSGTPLLHQRVKGVWGLDVHGRHHPLEKPIGVAVNSADFPVDAHKGSLFVITPEEQAHVILLKVADDVRQGAKNHK